MELVGSSQSTFGDMVSELGFSASMRPEAEYTLLAPLNTAFNGEWTGSLGLAAPRADIVWKKEGNTLFTFMCWLISE